MFEKYTLLSEGFKNVKDDNGQIIGFQVKTQIPYYRGIPLSMVEWIRLSVDGREVDQTNIRFSADGEDYFTLDEMTTVTSIKWEFGQNATIFVEHPGGLSPGPHEIHLSQAIRNAYYPFPIEGRRSRVFDVQ